MLGWKSRKIIMKMEALSLLLRQHEFEFQLFHLISRANFVNLSALAFMSIK